MEQGECAGLCRKLLRRKWQEDGIFLNSATNFYEIIFACSNIQVGNKPTLVNVTNRSVKANNLYAEIQYRL